MFFLIQLNGTKDLTTSDETAADNFNGLRDHKMKY